MDYFFIEIYLTMKMKALLNKRSILIILMIIAYLVILFSLPPSEGWDYMPTDSRVF